jgi:hypothetical protein
VRRTLLAFTPDGDVGNRLLQGLLEVIDFIIG